MRQSDKSETKDPTTDSFKFKGRILVNTNGHCIINAVTAALLKYLSFKYQNIKYLVIFGELLECL